MHRRWFVAVCACLPACLGGSAQLGRFVTAVAVEPPGLVVATCDVSYWFRDYLIERHGFREEWTSSGCKTDRVALRYRVAGEACQTALATWRESGALSDAARDGLWARMPAACRVAIEEAAP